MVIRQSIAVRFASLSGFLFIVTSTPAATLIPSSIISVSISVPPVTIIAISISSISSITSVVSVSVITTSVSSPIPSVSVEIPLLSG